MRRLPCAADQGSNNPPVSLAHTRTERGLVSGQMTSEKASAKRNVVKRGPLSGVRIADLGWYGVDPETTRILSWFGAEVIRVEHEAKLDYIRVQPPFALDGKADASLTVVEAVKQRKFNQSGLYNNFNPGKLCIRLNLARPEGRKLLEELINISDVVTENYSYDVMDKWGYNYETLRRIRPDVIYMSMAGMGHAGPDANVKTVGPSVQALSGLTFMAGLPGQEPSGLGFSYMDHQGAYHNCLAILMAIFHRNRTGRGQYIDGSTTDIAATLTGTKVLDYTANGRPSRRPDYPAGNRLEHPAAAPHGVYRCHGDDRWIAIAVFNDNEWRSLVDVMGSPPWASTPDFKTMGARLEHQDDLDQKVNSWTVKFDDIELMQILQKAGVRAGAVFKGADVERDPQLRHRKTFVDLDHSAMGRWPFEAVPAKLSATAGGWEWGSPVIAQDNDYFYREVLGIPDRQVQELACKGVL